MRKMLLTVAATALLLPAGVSAAPITFFGEDLSPGGTVPAGGNAENARNAFLATLAGGVGTEDFEGIAVGTTTPFGVNFPGSTGSITATIGSGASSATVLGAPSAGRFNTTSGGSNFLETDAGGDFVISFSSGVSAFGFYGTDIGDFGNELVLTASNGTTETLEVGNTVGSGGSTSGSLLFFGFIDTLNEYTSVAFANDPGGVDIFGFDDLTIGDAEQIINPPSEVPLPAPMALLLSGLAGLAFLRRRA